MSDQVLTQCPECSARIRVPEAAVGKTVRCPKCSTPFRVAAAAGAAPGRSRSQERPRAGRPSTTRGRSTSGRSRRSGKRGKKKAAASGAWKLPALIAGGVLIGVGSIAGAIYGVSKLLDSDPLSTDSAAVADAGEPQGAAPAEPGGADGAQQPATRPATPASGSGGNAAGGGGFISNILSQGPRASDLNNLRQIGLALHNFHASYGHFPAPATNDAQGEPLLSWRVHLLPFLGQENLYRQFHLNEPWDSPHNRGLLQQMPRVYGGPRNPGPTTTVVMVQGPGTAFENNRELRLRDIRDGTANTALIVEVADELATEWTRPDTYQFDPQNPTQGLTTAYRSGAPALFADGSVHQLPLDKNIAPFFTSAAGDQPPL